MIFNLLTRGSEELEILSVKFWMICVLRVVLPLEGSFWGGANRMLARVSYYFDDLHEIFNACSACSILDFISFLFRFCDGKGLTYIRRSISAMITGVLAG